MRISAQKFPNMGHKRSKTHLHYNDDRIVLQRPINVFINDRLVVIIFFNVALNLTDVEHEGLFVDGGSSTSI